MDAQNKAFQYRYVFLTVTPIIVACLILLLSFTFIHGQKTVSFDRKIGDIARMFFREPKAGYLEKTYLFERHSKQLLELGYFVSFALLDKNKTIINTKGLPVNESLLLKYKSQQSWIEQSRHYMLLPLSNDEPDSLQTAKINKENSTQKKSSVTGGAELKPANSYILVVIDKNHQALSHYQWFVVAFIVLLFCMIFALFHLRSIHKHLLNPLKNLQTSLTLMNSSKKYRAIKGDSATILSLLQEGINNIIKQLQEDRKGYKQKIDAATKEINENIESLEIKNIELDIARKKALEKNQVKSEFLANTSHEIRTPLNGIIGFTDLLKKTSLSQEQQEYLSTIEESAKNLLNSINDILDYSRLDNGTLRLEHKPFNIRNTIEQTLSLQAPRADEKNIKLIHIQDSNIPETLIGDSHRLQQVISHLVSNAIKFSSQGRIALHVQHIENNESRAHLKFIVQDDGIGLSAEEQQRLFKSFTQVDRGDNRNYSGSGLGLSIAEGLVKKMEGNIGVESKKGSGSSFWFTAIMGRDLNAGQNSAFSGTLKNVNVIVYDTDELGRLEISNKLNSWGANTHAVKLFSQIPQKAKDLVANARKFARYYPAAIIDAQTSFNSLDKLVLKKVITTLSKELMIPTVVICPPGRQSLVMPLLSSSNVAVLQRPLQSEKFYRSVYNQIGIFNNRSSLHPSFGTNVQQETPIKVLAVDDNPANLKLVTELLRDLNTDVSTALNGHNALDLVDKKSFDIILMDIQMPSMDGYETTRIIREKQKDNKRTPIVALTAHATGEDKLKILTSGMDDFLSKPVGIDDIHHVIDRWVLKESTNKPLDLTPPKKQPKEEKATPTKQSLNDKPDELLNSSINIPINNPVNIQKSIELAKDNSELAKDMLEMLLASLSAEKPLLVNHYEKNNLIELQEMIHKIHGGACYCGVPRLLAASSILDKNLKLKKTNNLNSEFIELKESIEQLLEWSEQYELDSLFGLSA